MGRRDLSPEDRELWRHVTRSVSPYHTPHHHNAYREPPPEPPSQQVDTEAPAAQREPAVRPPPRIHVQPPLAVGVTIDMDRNTARRLTRGQLPIDARIDLHGLTLAQAHGALTAFIRGAQNRGCRCVMVVTGKGSRTKTPDRGDDGVGKIRRETPHWLNQAALRPLVLAVTEARGWDGGTGAFYVLLKRRR